MPKYSSQIIVQDSEQFLKGLDWNMSITVFTAAIVQRKCTFAKNYLFLFHVFVQPGTQCNVFYKYLSLATDRIDSETLC